MTTRLRLLALPLLALAAAATAAEPGPLPADSAATAGALGDRGLSQDLSTYFDYHHTDNDTFDKIVPKDLDRAAAATAVTAWCLADAPQPIERVPADKRKLSW